MTIITKRSMAWNDRINRERDRRLSLGFTFNGNPYDFDETSKIRISGAGTLAGFAIAAGSPEGYYRWTNDGTDFYWIAQDNTKVFLDAQNMFAMAQYAAQWEARHIKAARILKDMDPIPIDYKNDMYWPVRGT